MVHPHLVALGSVLEYQLKENWLKSGWTNGSKRPVINIYMIINALICK